MTIDSLRSNLVAASVVSAAFTLLLLGKGPHFLSREFATESAANPLAGGVVWLADMLFALSPILAICSLVMLTATYRHDARS
jgi:hypothetical protein